MRERLLVSEGLRRQCIRHEPSERGDGDGRRTFSFPRALARSLAGLMMTICLMLPLSRTGSVCLTSSGSAGRRVKGCPWAARGKGMGLGSAGEESAWAGLRRFCVCVYLSWEAEEEQQQEEEVCGWVGGEFNNGNGEARS